MATVGPGLERSELVPGVFGRKDGETDLQGGLHGTPHADRGSGDLPSLILTSEPGWGHTGEAHHMEKDRRAFQPLRLS